MRQDSWKKPIAVLDAPRSDGYPPLIALIALIALVVAYESGLVVQSK